MPSTAAERSLAGKIAINTRWAHTQDRSAATAPARTAFDERFVTEVDPDGVMSPDELAKAVTSARSAYFSRLRHRAIKAQRLAAEARQAEAELRRAERAARLGQSLDAVGGAA